MAEKVCNLTKNGGGMRDNSTFELLLDTGHQTPNADHSGTANIDISGYRMLCGAFILNDTEYTETPIFIKDGMPHFGLALEYDMVFVGNVTISSKTITSWWLRTQKGLQASWTVGLRIYGVR